MPGEDVVEATRIVLGELPDLPHLPELPARGAIAGHDRPGGGARRPSSASTCSRPAGGSPTRPGVDHRRARSLLAQDLDVLEELTQGYDGPFKVQVAGPWTLASTVEKPRGDKVLSDVGARRELAQALAEGVAEHLADVQRRVPGATLVLQVDEPRAAGRAAPAGSRRPPASTGTARSTRRWPRRPSSGSSRPPARRRRWRTAVPRTCPSGCCAVRVPTAVSVDLGVLAAGGVRRAGHRARHGRSGVAGRGTPTGAHAPTDPGRARPGPAAARHARLRPRRGGRPAWC